MDRDTVFINKQKSGIDAQIKAFADQQKEFEIDTRPFIVFGNFTIDTPVMNKRIKASTIIGNAGKQPAFIISCGYSFIMSIDTAFCDFTKVPENIAAKNDFLPNNQTYPTITDFGYFTQKEIDMQKTKPYFVYFIGYFNYRRINSNRVYTVRFCNRINLSYPHFNKVIYYKAT